MDMDAEQFENMLERQEERRNQNLKEILTALLPTMQDHERLIKIEAKVETVILLANSNRTADLEKISLADKKADAAHRRVDTSLKWVMGTMLITIGGMLLTALYVYAKMGGHA